MAPPKFILNDGTHIPWLAFGTGTALYGRDATDFVKAAIDAGINHLDGAQMYKNEETLGEGIKLSGKPRSELFITTKLLPTLPPGQTVESSLRDSLSKLGLDYVDLFLVHSPHPVNQTPGKLRAVWAEVEGVKKLGLAKSIGVSNFRVEDLNDILQTATIVPAVNQIELHPYVWKAAEPVVNLGREKGIITGSYGGLTPVVALPDGPVTPVLEKVTARLTDARGQPVSQGQVLTKWLLQKGILVVTTSSKVARIKEFQDVENVPDLTEEEIKRIDDEGAKVHLRRRMKHVYGE